MILSHYDSDKGKRLGDEIKKQSERGEIVNEERDGYDSYHMSKRGLRKGNQIMGLKIRRKKLIR